MSVSHPRRLVHVWPVVVAVVLILAVVAWTRQAHARTPWSRHPERISYCDRSYQRSPNWLAMSAAEINDLGVGGTEPLDQVGRIPPFVGSPILARRAVPDDGWRGAWDLCTTGLWLEVGDDEYTYYGLVGGF